MKRLFIILISLLTMMTASHGAKAQEVTIDLVPGWNYIAYPYPTTVELNTFLSSITPMNGDIIKSFYGSSLYLNGRWRGAITILYPGEGYHYFSNNSEIITLVLDNPIVPEETITITTGEPAGITAVSAVVGAFVTIGDDNHIFARGICWGTEPDPNVDDNYTSDGTGSGSFTTTINDLESNTLYYVRAYAVSDYGLTYGDTMSFTTLEGGGVPIGAIDGLFSVSDTQHVYFSKGNLQYIGSVSNPYWRFAEHQWDYLGNSTGQYSNDQNVDRDLFGWGTSGYNHGANCYQPWNTNTSNGNYYAYGNSTYNLYDQTGQADWGYNAISNGGNTPNMWRTLTKDEWSYVLFTRNTNSGIRYVWAEVGGNNGIILLPDNWSNSTYSLNIPDYNPDDDFDYFQSNIITATVWTNIFETNGAVFLPAPAYRSGTATNYGIGYSGKYWSATCSNNDKACGLSFDNGGIYISVYNNRYYGQSVRLVYTAATCSYNINASPNPNEGGIVSGVGMYTGGQTCTLTATANDGYTFTNWTENDEVVSTDATYTFTVTGDRTLVANFTQNGGTVPTGAINGKFSVSADQQVYFSQGNLQYQASTNTWKFAENQYDYVGSANSNISSSYSGWIDLFGWGTSGWNSGNTYYHPWDSNDDSIGLTYGPPGEYNLTGSYANADWGVYNPISNGGNQTNQWRTLTQPEWDYIFNTRTTVSGIRYAKANVNNINGVILLPDDWSSTIFNLSNTNNSGASFSSNTITASQWNILEQAGAVFLPAAGRRYMTSVDYVGSFGYYWSASYYSSNTAYNVDFRDNLLRTNDRYRYYGQSVRLVYPAE